MDTSNTEMFIGIGAEERRLDVRVDYRWHEPMPGRREAGMGMELEPAEPGYAEIGKVEAEIHNGRFIDVTALLSQAQLTELANEISFRRDPSLIYHS